MPKLTIEQTHSLDPATVRERLDALNERLAAKYGLDAKWHSDTEATFKRTGASGSISCHPDRVVILVELSFALAPVKGRVEARIREELATVLRKAT
jgi:putative polyhydroxyalkanoate system protein